VIWNLFDITPVGGSAFWLIWDLRFVIFKALLINPAICKGLCHMAEH
jgi:hypothetical protein